MSGWYICPECTCHIASWWAQEGGARVHVFDSACSIHQASMLSLLSSPSVFLKWIRALMWAANITTLLPRRRVTCGRELGLDFFLGPLYLLTWKPQSFLDFSWGDTHVLQGHVSIFHCFRGRRTLQWDSNCSPLPPHLSRAVQTWESTPWLSVDLVLFVWTVDCGFQRYLGLKLNEKTVKSPRHLSLSLFLLSLWHFKTWVFIYLVVSWNIFF